MKIEKGTADDIGELESLYNQLNDYLSSTVNYPGWIKEIYPVRETAERGIRNNNLFVLKIDNRIAGSIILSHEPEDAYYDIEWGMAGADYKDVIVIHTFVVHPEYMNRGVGTELMDFTKQYAIEQGARSIRLDVSEHNTPAIRLYRKGGYRYMGTVDLGLDYPHLKWFQLYELLL